MALRIDSTQIKVSHLLAELVAKIRPPVLALEGTIAQTKMDDWVAYERYAGNKRKPR